MIVKRSLFRKALVLSIISLLTLTLLLGALPRMASAAYGIQPPEEDCDIVGSLPPAYSEGEDAAGIAAEPWLKAYCGPGGCRTYELYEYIGPAYAEPAAYSPYRWQLVSDFCEAPAIWAAGVCEPYAGGYFSVDGNFTLDSPEADAQLLVGAGPSGPWLPVETNSAPWVFTQEQLTALANVVGVSHYSELWFKAGDLGFPVNLASLVADRNASIGDWCPPIEDNPPES